MIVPKITASAAGVDRFIAFGDVPANERSFSGKVSVYALVDPRDDTVRYVGVTSKSLARRLGEHLASPTNRRTRAWFADLLAVGMAPSIERLQPVEHNWQVAEMEWIAWFRARGDLLNVDDGGVLYEAGSGWDDVKEQKAATINSSAIANAIDYRPPPCARDTRSLGEKRTHSRRIKRAMENGQRKAAKKRAKARISKREDDQAIARTLTSIEPIIRKSRPSLNTNGTTEPRQDRGWHANITPRASAGRDMGTR